MLYHDVEAGKAKMAAGTKMDDPEWLKAFLVANARQLGMAGKLLFPIPERGLAQRLYRVKAKTVLVWGESDRLIVPAYGEAFRAAIRGAELVTIPQAAHLVIHEQPGAVVDALSRLG